MCVFFFFKQKTAYEMRISDWSSDVCSSDLSSQYSDSVIYIGDGDSSDRNWTIATSNSAGIRNEGTGTLTITGNMASSGSGTVAFGAQTADFELLGVLSGGDYLFGGNTGRSITLGSETPYTGLTTIGGITVRPGVLPDSGLAQIGR